MIDVLPQLKQTILTATLIWDSKAIELCLNLLFIVRGQKTWISHKGAFENTI